MKKIYAAFPILLISFQSFAQNDTPTVKNLDQVVVTGQYAPQSMKNSVYRVRVINNEMIKLSGSSNVQQVLNTQLGFRFSNDNTLGTSDVELMGMSGRNVKILLDGVPLIDRGDTRESLNQVDLYSIDRIEIVEGPMSVSYGSDGLAGVINIITKKLTKDNLLVSAKIQEETNGDEYYPFSYEGTHIQHVDINWRKKKWNLMAGGTHNDFDGFGGDEYGRNKKWKPKEQWLGNARLGYDNGVFNIYYRLDALDETIISRGAMNEALYKARDQEYLTNRYSHQVQAGWNLSNKVQVSGLLAYSDYKRKTTTTIHDFVKNTDELSNGEGEQDVSKLNGLTFRSSLFYKLSPNLSFQPGIDINHEEASGARISGSPAITDYAFFVSSEIKLGAGINLRPGLRFIKNSVYDAPPVIPSINAKFNLNKQWGIRLSYAYGFRAPAIRELYFDFHDANHDIVGNPDLKAEYSNSFSGSLSYMPAGTNEFSYQLALSPFYNQFNNLISFAQSQTNQSQYVTVNIDKFKTTGATLENKFNWKNLAATLGLSYIGRFNSFSEDETYKDEDLASFTWTPEVNSNIIYSISKIGTSVTFFYKFTGKRPGYTEFYNNTTGQNEVGLSKISSFHWADLTITKAFKKYITVSGGVKNLFDVTDLNSTSVTGGAHTGTGSQAMGYGRSYFLGLGLQWSKH